MARLYQLKVERGGNEAVLYYHDNGTLELVDADSGEVIDYLQTKLRIAELMFGWMKKYNVTSVECVKV